MEEQGTWAAQKHSKAGYGRPVDRGVWTAKTVKRPRQQPAHPQYANYWAPLTRKRHTMPHSAQSQHANYWAPRTRKRHQQEHRPQRPTESSDPTQHAKGRTGDRPGPRKGATTRRNVTQGVNYSAPLTRKRHIPPHPAQPRHTNDGAPQTRKRHQQEHRPQRPTERSDPTQHAKGRPGECPGPRKGATTRRNVTRGGGGGSPDHPPPPWTPKSKLFWAFRPTNNFLRRIRRRCISGKNFVRRRPKPGPVGCGDVRTLPPTHPPLDLPPIQ